MRVRDEFHLLLLCRDSGVFVGWEGSSNKRGDFEVKLS